MAITKNKKREIAVKLTDVFAAATSVSFVGFSKLTVAEISAVRKDLQKNGVRYFVAKKTLLKRALAERGYTGQLPELPGEIAVAWTSEDVLAPTRGIYEHGRKLKGGLKLLGGVFDGAFVDAGQMTALATIPPLPILRGMFVNVLNSPIQGFVTALDKISEKRAG
jgi:large subunit ribosomal protein L10